MTVEADATNISTLGGDEVTELYLTYPTSEGTPVHALGGFTRVYIPAGGTRHLSFRLDARQLSQVLLSGQRVVLPGEYSLFVGGSQPGKDAAGVTGSFIISGQRTIGP